MFRELTVALAALCLAAPAAAQYNLYFGNFHSHCNISNDATGPNSGPPATAFAYARDVAGIDILALTDHSHYMSASEYNTLQSNADTFTQNGTFVAIAGQEHGSLSTSVTGAFGHINVWEASVVINQATYRYNLPLTYQWIAANVDDVTGSPLAASFNHPYSGAGAGEWEVFHDFQYDATGDEGMQQVEVINGRRSSAYEPEYFTALANGWHVGALGNQDNHEGMWGDQPNNIGNIPLTGVWATALTKADVLEALRSRRTFAMEVQPATDRISLAFTADGNWMGSEYSTAADSITFDVDASALTSIASLSLFRNGVLIASTGAGGASFSWTTHDTPGPGDFYYLVRLNQSDGDRAWSSPIWVHSTSDFSQPIANVNADNPNGTPALWFQNITVQGIVTVDTDTLSTIDNQFFIQDATGGVMVQQFGAQTFPVSLGQNVLVSGSVDFIEGQTFINPSSVAVQGQGGPPPPIALTSSQLANLGENYEGSLVEIADVSITAGTWPPPGSDATLVVDDGSGPCNFFIDRDTSVDELGGPPSDPFTIRGIVRQFDPTEPYDSGYAIMPRWGNDVMEGGAVDVFELPIHDATAQTALLGNSPNPFRPSTLLRFEIAGAETQPVRLDVYDVNGRLVRKLVDRELPPGSFETRWDGRSDAGERAAAGIYFYRLTTPAFSDSKKMVLLQ